jgi:hypothetical protein
MLRKHIFNKVKKEVILSDNLPNQNELEQNFDQT